jgi:hypothetical protein
MRRSRALLAWVTVLAGCSSAAAPIVGNVGNDAGSDANVPPGGDASTHDGASDGAHPDGGGDGGVACILHVSTQLHPTIDAIVTAMRSGAPEGSNAVPLPDAATRDAFGALVVRVLDGDDVAACDLPTPYRLVVLDDAGGGAGAVRVVGEFDAKGKPAPQKFWGTYAAPDVVSAHARPLVVEAPHPIFDVDTESESTELFLRGAARYLLLAGSHRCANTSNSACSGTTTACGTGTNPPDAPYRTSDAAHTDALPFYAVHAALSTAATELSFLQLHGNAEPCPAALVSDESGSWSDAGLAGAIATELDARGVGVGRCGAGFPTATCDLCGTDNVEARESAGATPACSSMGPTSGYGRVVQIEQQAALRKDPVADAGGYAPLIDAVLAALPAP